MTKTTFGKSLVFVNLVLSLLMAAWAQGVYSSRIDWSNNKGKDGAPDGELVRRVARVRELGDALRPAGLAWNDGRVAIAGLDTRRTADRQWYEGELTFLRTGATRDNPARVVKVERGQPVLGEDGRPVLVAGRDAFGQPLVSFVAYSQDAEALGQQIDQKGKELAKAIDEDAALSVQLAGDPAAGVKGLQQRILDARAKLAEATKEQEFVRPLLINAVVNSDLVFKRQRSLEARIRELEKVGVAGR